MPGLPRSQHAALPHSTAPPGPHHRSGLRVPPSAFPGSSAPSGRDICWAGGEPTSCTHCSLGSHGFHAGASAEHRAPPPPEPCLSLPPASSPCSPPWLRLPPPCCDRWSGSPSPWDSNKHRWVGAVASEGPAPLPCLQQPHPCPSLTQCGSGEIFHLNKISVATNARVAHPSTWVQTPAPPPIPASCWWRPWEAAVTA